MLKHSVCRPCDPFPTLCLCHLTRPATLPVCYVCLQVYGETSFELVNKIIEKVVIKPSDSFIDLGSGRHVFIFDVPVHMRVGGHTGACYGQHG